MSKNFGVGYSPKSDAEYMLSLRIPSLNYISPCKGSQNTRESFLFLRGLLKCQNYM